MRHTILVTAVLSTLMVLTACQSDDETAAMVQALNSNDPQDKTTNDEEDLNLDPVLDETDTGTRSESTRSKETNSECIDKEGQRGVCVNYYLCDQESRTIIEDGRTIIDVRSREDCQALLEVCCQRNQVLRKSAKSELTPLPTELGHDVVRSDEKPKANECGWSNPGVNVFFTPRSGDGGVTDGKKVYADFGDFPWMVAVLKKKQAEEKWEKSNYIGGGSLIHPSVVMTTAHKIAGKKPEDLKIRAGEWDTKSLDEEYEHQEKAVAKIVIHRDYFRPSLYNDIALLFLEEPVDLTDEPHIGIGCLGKQMPPADTSCFSMGWGADNFNNKSVFAPILKKVKLPLVEHSQCEEMLQKTRLGRHFRLHTSLTCAGGQAGIDTCKGDGGSPLVCPIGVGGSRFAIFGMVAYGIGKCGGTDIPGVYVNVPELYDWVEQQLYAQGYDVHPYVY